jgi:hypothetical protein
MLTRYPVADGVGSLIPLLSPDELVTTLYDVVSGVAAPCMVPAALTAALVEYNIPVVSLIVPGAMNVDGVDRVMVPEPFVTETWLAVGVIVASVYPVPLPMGN